MWIHEHQHWPNFTWDIQALASKISELRYRQGRLLGRMEGIGFELKQEASLTTLTFDVIKSSAIEGENLNPIEVKSSIARNLGIDFAGLIPSSRKVDGIVEILLDATQCFSQSLTKERLFGWHAALFPTGRSGMHQITVGNWRPVEAGSMRVVSGPLGKEKIHFEAPMAERLNDEMSAFIQWFNQSESIDPLIMAGLAHFWFITIHPFEDGNGRIARAIGDMGLARADGTQYRFYSISSQFELERNDYYEQLEKQQRATPDVTQWLTWFFECLDRALNNAEVTLNRVFYKNQLWQMVNQKSINERQKNVINRMLEETFTGFMNTSKYAKLTKCSTDTAFRDLKELKERGIFIQNPGGGRSTSYRLPDPEMFRDF
jgi:Fic family protein